MAKFGRSGSMEIVDHVRGNAESARRTSGIFGPPVLAESHTCNPPGFEGKRVVHTLERGEEVMKAILTMIALANVSCHVESDFSTRENVGLIMSEHEEVALFTCHSTRRSDNRGKQSFTANDVDRIELLDLSHVAVLVKINAFV